MKKQISKKKITVKDYIKRSLITSTVYFILLITWQSAVFAYNKNSESQLSPWVLVLALLAFAVWVSCYFEIRTVTPSGERFLGYKCYILFFLKLLLMPMVVLVTLLTGLYSNQLAFAILGNCGICTVYYICVLVFLLPYRAHVKENFCELYISYRICVKKWYVEGSVEFINNNADSGVKGE